MIILHRRRSCGHLLAATMLCSLAGGTARAQEADPMAARVSAMEKMIRELQAEVAALRGTQGASGGTAVASATGTPGGTAPAESEVATSAEGVAARDATGSALAANDQGAPPQSAVESNNDGELAPSSLRMPTLKLADFPVNIFGQIQYDFSYVENPGVLTDNLGYNGRARRLIFGFRGDLPGDFRYNLEFMLAQAGVDYEDVTLAYEPEDSSFSAKIGFFYPFVSLENLTSNKRNSFVERAQMNDAFVLNRRIGGAVGYVNKTGTFRVNAGLFNGQINSSFTNTEWQTAIRAVYSPTIDGNQLHLAAQHQYRRTPKQNQSFLYQARPFTQSTNVRFAGTGPATDNGTLASGIATEGDQIFGVEAAGIFGPLHLVSEAQYVTVDAIRPGEALAQGRTTTGQRLASDPEFYSVYGEIGYFLTGETRGYRNGRFFITKILDPVDKGGIGAFQLVGRVDHLDLTTRVGGTGMGIVDGVLNGGTQTGYQVALNWFPTDSLRFTTQYTRGEVTGGPSAGQVVPLGSGPLYDRDFGYDAIVARAQVEF